MHRRNRLLSLFSLLLIATATLWTTPAAEHALHAQVRIPDDALLDEARIEQLLGQGRELEQQRRWGEALSLYEKSLREHPGQHDLKQRHTLARLHFDLGRRYADTSFAAAVASIGEQRALDLYGEVLLKVEAHYVNSPDWRQLLQRGNAALDVALTEAAFVDRHLAHATPEQIDAFRRHLRTLVAQQSAQDRYQCRNDVVVVARAAQQQLGLPTEAVILEYTCGAAGALDAYSAFLTASQLDDVYSQIEGNFVGLGVELKADGGSLLIVHVIPGSPADVGEIAAGDRIVEVDGRQTADISNDKAADMLRGPEGSSVEVAVTTADGARRRINLVRRRVEVPSVEQVKMLDTQYGIGYFKLTSFQKSTSRDVDAALWELHRLGMRSLVIDVRGNPGGLLTASVEVSDKFLTQGTIVSTRGRNAQEDFNYVAHATGTWQVPLVVLIDGDSASAAEIFAGAVGESGRATIVGQRSFGKGSVQGIFPLHANHSGVRLTTAKFYSPSGQPISHRGVWPDVSVRNVAKPVDGQPLSSDADAALTAALEAARQRVALK